MDNMLADKLLSRVDGVRSTGQDRWQARCPAHDDKTPSLAIPVELVRSVAVLLLPVKTSNRQIFEVEYAVPVQKTLRW